MMGTELRELSYFPGCSMKTSAGEADESLKDFCKHVGIQLIELEDWSCCGSSSAHCIDSLTAEELAGRNLALADPDRPLLIPCPSCSQQIRKTQNHLKTDADARARFRTIWGKAFNPDLEILSFFEFLECIDFRKLSVSDTQPLKGLKFVPYYGCMLIKPLAERRKASHHGLIERTLEMLGATAVPWTSGTKCCGTFLAITMPDQITSVINEINFDGIKARADCIVTACTMCQLNLELRCSLKNPIPTLHLTEVLSLAFGSGKSKSWFQKHLVDPKPTLQMRGIVA